MSSKAIEPRKVSKAELKFREAFERLKVGKPDILPKGTPLSQNNVAKEAGVDPSALRRARFPELVADIQAWIESHKDEAPQKSPRQMVLAQRSRNRDLQEKVDKAISSGIVGRWDPSFQPVGIELSVAERESQACGLAFEVSDVAFGPLHRLTQQIAG